jgi:PelA/Pel-15E family pectate lyase
MVFCLSLFVIVAPAQQAAVNTKTTAAPIDWKDSLKQKPEWYGGDEASRIADNLLLYQRDSGGWPKNINMAAALAEPQRIELAKQKQEADSTIDNGATFTQLAYLARVYTARKQERHKDAFLKGVDYLLKAQYANGGWPQYYPPRHGYYTHITFNDGAMIGVMKLLRDIAQQKSAYLFVDDARRALAAQAVEKGIDLILKTQVAVEGKPTVWAAQYDEVTLAPAAARKFEPVSLTGGESVGIVQFLMSINRPDQRVIESIEAAIAWYKKSKISGVRWTEKRDASRPGGFERVAIQDSNAGPIWARFYEIGSNRPIFIGRDSRIKYSVAEIEAERRNGYQWYVYTPAELLDEDYPAWQKKQRR